MAVALTATLDAARYAARLDVTGIPYPPADTLTIERTSPSGNAAGVRGAVDATVTAITFTRRDYELPFDLPVTYQVTVYDGATVVGTASTTFEVVYGQCDAWLVDIARPTNSIPVLVESLTQLAFPIPSGVHRVLDRRAPVVVALPAQTPETELVVLTDNDEQRERARYLLGSGYPFLLRTIPEQNIGNLYLAASGFTEERFLTAGTAPERRYTIGCVQVERPDPGIYVPLAPNDYANAKATYASYAALKAGVANYDELAYTYPAGTVNPLPPWPPDDI